MFGLAVLIVMGLYLLISFAVVHRAISYARRNGKSAKRWGWGAAFVMYSLVLWDWIPTVAAHQYYCATEAGFWEYKTPEQWKKENPGVMEALVANKGVPSTRQGDMENYVDTYFINQRIKKIVQQYRALSWLTVHRHEQTILDNKTNEVIARYVDFGSYNAKWGGLKFWMSIERCKDDGTHPQHQFYDLENQLTGKEK